MCHELDACLETPVKFRSDYDFSSISMEFGLYCDKKKDEANPDIHDGKCSPNRISLLENMSYRQNNRSFVTISLLADHIHFEFS